MKNFIKDFSIILCLLLINTFTINSCHAQGFTFADTYPVNNSDSLERWLTRNSKPNTQRLQNLIALERTYNWESSYKRGTLIEAIKKMSLTLNSQVGMASLNYLKGTNGLLGVSTAETFKYLSDALKAFESLKDISGQIHCYAILSRLNFDGTTQVIGEKKIAQTYLSKARELLKESNQIHDELFVNFASALVNYNSKNNTQLKNDVSKALALIKNNANLRYGNMKFRINEALYYYTQNDFRKSANIYEELLKNISPKNYHALITCYYNLGNDNIRLGLDKQATDAYKSGIDVFLKSGLKYYPPIKFIYQSYRENAQNRQEYQLANSLADSLIKYEKISNESIKTNELVALEAKNLLEKKEIEFEILKQRQTLLQIVLIVGLCFLGSVLYFMLRLRQYNKKINELTKHREQFYTIVAHDLREPINNLSAISPAVRFLIKNKRKEELEKVLDNIDNHANKSLLLVNNLLEWGISNNYQSKNNVQEVNVSKVVKELCEYYWHIIHAKEITIITKITENIKLKTNLKAIEIIIRNLIDNAQKFTNEGGDIEALVEKINDGKKVKISIKNNGKVINPEQLEYIKKIFKNKIKPEVGMDGLGLGIVLISTFAEKINGLLSVESSIEHGTVFSLVLSDE